MIKLGTSQLVLRTQEYTTAGSYSWQVPSNVNIVWVSCCGGGGGGSNASTTAGTGGNTTFGTYLTASGGTGGAPTGGWATVAGGNERSDGVSATAQHETDGSVLYTTANYPEVYFNPATKHRVHPGARGVGYDNSTGPNSGGWSCINGYGRGGDGSGGSTTAGTGGGGGGGFIDAEIQVAPGETISITVGAAGTGQGTPQAGYLCIKWYEFLGA